MPGDERTRRIISAVHAILEHCTETGADALQRCIDDLVDDPSWNTKDMLIVKEAVLRRLDEMTRG